MLSIRFVRCGRKMQDVGGQRRAVRHAQVDESINVRTLRLRQSQHWKM